MKAALTSRERVDRMFDRHDHDRVPRFETCWDETLDRWMDECLPGANRSEAMERVLERLQADLAYLCWYWPHPFPERNEVISEDELTRVLLGPSGTIERYWKNKSGTPEHLGWECENRDVWESRYKPAMENQPVQINISAVKERVTSAARSGKWTYLAGVSAFEVLRKILGDEAFMINLVDDPEWIADIARTATGNLLRNYQAILDAGVRPDGLWIFDDMAFNTMTFCSPGMYREIIWPEHRRITEFGHANGMRVIFHSDGDLRGVIPDLIDAGFDCLQPLESKAGMDIRKLVPQYGGKLAFFGNIDVMKLLTNDLGLIEEEVSSKLAAGMETRGYIFHSDHSVPPQVSWETYQAVIEMVEKYGMY
jgi:hypothetical protein